jgi:hypothetical protein
VKIDRVSYSLVGHGARPSTSGLVQDIGVAGVSEIKNGRLDVHDTFSIGKIEAGALKMGPMSLAAGIDNVPPEPIGQFTNAAASISQLTSDPQTKSRMVKEKSVDLIVAIVKDSPVLSFDLHAVGSGGEATGKAIFGISPDLANDPMMKAGHFDNKGMAAQVWNKYGHATIEIAAPPGFLAQVTKAGQLKELEQSGILVRDGANDVCHAIFKEGGWLINGQKIEFPAPQAPSNPGNRHS